MTTTICTALMLLGASMAGVAVDGMATWGKVYCWQRLSDGLELLAMELLSRRAKNPARAETIGTRLYLRAMEAATWV